MVSAKCLANALTLCAYHKMKEETIGTRIRAIRKYRGLTQAQLAEKMFVQPVVYFDV